MAKTMQSLTRRPAIAFALDAFATLGWSASAVAQSFTEFTALQQATATMPERIPMHSWQTLPGIGDTGLCVLAGAS